MYHLANAFFTRYPRKSIRLLEVIPPLTSVFLLTLPFWGSLVFPVQLAYFIIFFDVYWLYKSVNLVFYSYLVNRKIHQTESVDWYAKAKNLAHFEDLCYLIIIPTYKESVEKLKATLESLVCQTVPLKSLYVCVAMEKRETEAKEKSRALEMLYKDKFGALFFTFHPDLAHEVRGKSSNQAYAAKKAYALLVKKMRLPIDYITVSSADADSIFDAAYFAYLGYHFLTSKVPHYTFWQSANVSYNNFWRVPTFTRIISFFGSLWRTSLLAQRLRLIPNATYSLSFKLLRDIGYWDTDVIPEDYRVFFKAFFKTSGRATVAPIYLKTSMDAPLSQTYIKSLLNKYNQEMRWAWGISDDGLYLRWWLLVRGVPFFKKTYLIGNVLLDHILWPVNWFIITISANIVVLINPIFSRTTLGYNLPRLSGFILTLCLLALFTMFVVDFNLRAKHNPSVSKVRQLVFPFEFVLMPIAGFFLSSLPALISHIMLILGRRLEYKVTEKA